ncbi:PD-(D/E)XK nuclease family protein [Cyanobacterium aponinum]|uniref:PD-(D/E)XK nuclease family protein n=1 Tax=Cyanobacterium aponinum TaxID=379064 RepID=UPI000C12C19E|nr:PD-(D/E)XK nuclease family protein [Cyanobacterium aponinum]PHV62537.1 hypothetical protein CSQ80_09730 [Cyanobacterium aponinum IPPAS B-1201]
MNKYWKLSQSQLNLLQTCPPQFQKVYIEKYTSIPNLSNEEKTVWGKKFHYLMQQYQLGVNIELLKDENPDLIRSAKTLIEATEDIWSNPKIKLREAEYQINYQLDKYLFTVIYDLLVFYDNKAIIFDWKTYPLPENNNRILHNWQTKLYLYVLAENSNYLPEQISFTYWFVKQSDKLQNLTINYDQKKHSSTEKELKNLLVNLEKYYQNYRNNNIDFPHHSKCETCFYRKNFAHLFVSNNEFIPQSLDDIF